MTKHICIAIALFISASPLCHAMEVETQNISPTHILATLTTIKQPHSVICFPNNIVAIVGGYGCNICEFSPNTKSINVNNNFPTHYQAIAAHPNKKMLAFYDNNCPTSKTTLAVYDRATTIKLWETTTPLFGHPVFIPMTDEIVTCGRRTDLQSFDYNKNSLLSKLIDLPGNRSSYTSHPKQREILFITDYNCEEKKNVCTMTLFQPMKWRRLEFSIEEGVSCCKYSPDGSLIAVNHEKYGCSILNPISGYYNKLIDHNKNKPECAAMAFHPTTAILATLSIRGDIIYYWNTTTRQLITMTQLTVPEEENLTYLEYPFDQRLDFSCDGTNLIVALNDKCLMLEVPFKIFEDRSVFAYWLLKNYQRNQGAHTIPDDIINFLMHTLLETSNFHPPIVNEKAS